MPFLCTAGRYGYSGYGSTRYCGMTSTDRLRDGQISPSSLRYKYEMYANILTDSFLQAQLLVTLSLSLSAIQAIFIVSLSTNLYNSSFTMVHLSTVIGVVSSAALIAAAPAVTPLEARASCTFSGATGAADALKNKASCTTITLNNVAVPAGTTLNLEGLKSGTQVCSNY